MPWVVRDAVDEIKQRGGPRCRVCTVRVDTTLLHFAQLNPLSAPFWSRMGYRPLWTGWEVRPAASLR